MRRGQEVSIWVAIGLIALLAFITPDILRRRGFSGKNSSQSDTTLRPQSLAISSNTISQSPDATQQFYGATNTLQEICGCLRLAPDKITARTQLENARPRLASMPKNAAATIIRQFLDSKTDAPTQLGFKVGRNGQIAKNGHIGGIGIDIGHGNNQ